MTYSVRDEELVGLMTSGGVIKRARRIVRLHAFAVERRQGVESPNDLFQKHKNVIGSTGALTDRVSPKHRASALF
jgi:hypothetical protein